MSTICTKCKKSHEETTKFCAICKEKEQQRKKKARLDNLEKARERDRQKYVTISEKRKEKARQKYADNIEKERERGRQKYTDNIEKERERGRQKYTDNIEKERERGRQKYTDNIEKERERAATHKRTIADIKRSALRRKLCYDLTDEYAASITDEPCFYCEEETTISRRNGIDRLNNSVGYVIENCVSCCNICNMMKKCLDPMTFVERCRQISVYHGGIGSNCDYWTDVKGYQYSDYKYKMKSKDFQLTKEEYENIRCRDCTYCGRSCTDTHTNGIDRIDNNIGYVVGNCTTSCRDCNISKRTLQFDIFVSQNKKITLCMNEDKMKFISRIPRQIYNWGGCGY
jgi:hypothetical protein